MIFEAYVEQVLAPTLHRGQVVVLDNLSAHKGEKIRELNEGRGCELLYLPSYSPDLNPIEEAFSKIKRLVRKAEAGSREVLVEAIGLALSAVDSKDTRSFFEHCGYRMPVQSLWYTLSGRCPLWPPKPTQAPFSCIANKAMANGTRGRRTHQD
jgi:transposase